MALPEVELGENPFLKQLGGRVVVRENKHRTLSISSFWELLGCLWFHPYLKEKSNVLWKVI